MRSYLLFYCLALLLLIINRIVPQSVIIAAKKDLIQQFKNSEIPRIYNDIKEIKINDKSETKKKGFIRYKYSISACHGQLSEFNASQVEINLHGDSNSIQVNLRNLQLHMGCNAYVKALIRISGSFTVDATIPLIHIKVTPSTYSREKGLKSLSFNLIQSDVQINPSRDIKFRLDIKNCPGFIDRALQSLAWKLFTQSNDIKDNLNKALRKAVERGLHRLAEKTALQSVIPDTNVSLTYSFQKTPKITDNQIFLYLQSYFYPINAELIDGKIPVPARFRQNRLQLLSDNQNSDNSGNSFLFFNQNLINSGLNAALVAKRTYIIDNKFMRLFNSNQVIDTTYLKKLMPEIGYNGEQAVEVRLFLVPDQKSNFVKFGKNRLVLDLKFQSQIFIKSTSQEIMTIQIQVKLNVRDLRGEKGDGIQKMINVYGTLEDIELIDFEIKSTSNQFNKDTIDNMEQTIEAFFILAQAVINKDIMRYPYWIPVDVLNVVTVSKAQAYLSEQFGLITAQINAN